MATPLSSDGRGGNAPRSISPTDISQFVRLEQCERYLRLRLRERAEGRDFLDAEDVAPQEVSPILSRSGGTFEEQVEVDVRARFPTFRFTDERRRIVHVTHDNERLVELITDVAPGEAYILMQPRIEADIDGWRLRGDVDLLRVECDADGVLRFLIADMKSSTASKVEHRLQVAFYHEMLADLLAARNIAHDGIELAILYRGPVRESLLTPAEDRETQDRQRADAEATFGTSAGLLDRIADVDAYLGSVRDLVTGDDSIARRLLATDFDQIPFHLTVKCDGCLYNEFCMKRSAATDDLSLLPHLTQQDKRSLKRAGIDTTSKLAALKTLQRGGTTRVDGEQRPRIALIPKPGREETCRELAATWPVGPRLDELIHRALRYERWKDRTVDALSWIPNSGYSSLPYSDAEQNPNLVTIYLDAQHDYLLDRIYMLGALVVGREGGQEVAHRRRSVVALADGPPDSDEREQALFVEWISDTLRAIVDVAAPNADGEARAPIHLVFVNGFAQRALLDGLARHASAILGATALYDFVTQLAAYDSPISSYLEQEIREHKNYPMICQSLQAVSAFLKFDWNAPEPFRKLFRARQFDFWGKFDAPPDGATEVPGLDGWFTSRARFNSQIPLEYAYVAWDELPAPEEGDDPFLHYRAATPELLRGYHARRLEAMEHIARDFAGNRQTSQREFDLPDLAAFEEIARTLAHALDEFVTIERHVELATWKRERLPDPEQRVLAGTTLVVRYLEEDQEPGVAAQNRENARRRVLREELRAEWRAANPDAKQVRLPRDQRAKCEWSNTGMRLRLRICVDDVACDLEEALRLTTIRKDSWLVIYPRWTVDSRLPEAEQYRFSPTVKQLLYGMRCTLERIAIEPDADGRARRAWAEVRMNGQGGSGPAGYGFSTMGDNERPLEDGEIFTLDANPNNINAGRAHLMIRGLIDSGGENTLYHMLAGTARPDPDWPATAVAGQERFLAGLDALHTAGKLHDFEASKREFIGGHGSTPLLLVQGPPGTGKSYSTAFAILARIQGAMAANRDFRVFLSCKTHAATDVLLENVSRAQSELRLRWSTHPEIMRAFFDERLLHLPLYRLQPREDVPAGVTPLPSDTVRAEGQPKATERLQGQRWLVAAGTPGSFYKLITDRWTAKDLFGHHLADCLVLDEASQMSLPEAIMAALPLGPIGSAIVVGDHRQMPPIVKHDWASEPRRSFRQFRTYESLFLALMALEPPIIRFAESFRLHADMAEFLRREIYVHDGIPYYSRQERTLADHPVSDSFIAAVLAPEHPLTVVVHDEAGSQVRNDFERQLLTPILATLASPELYHLDHHEGLGVVVPHRAQRASLQDELVRLMGPLSDLDEAVVTAVDTVERFQGGERIAILIGATESDRDYVLANGEFLLDPRRLTVAMSRAKRKLVLVASRSVFEVFSADEETFAHAQLWKNLLRHTCTKRVWSGMRGEHAVTVWGNRSSRAPRA